MGDERQNNESAASDERFQSSRWRKYRQFFLERTEGGVVSVLTGRWSSKPKDHKQVMRDDIKPACTALGLPSASWLTFRRTFATWADRRGVSAKQRGELMATARR